MKLSDLEKVNELQHKRAELQEIYLAAITGRVNSVVYDEDNEYKIGDALPNDVIRHGIVDGCRREIHQLEEDLKVLGVDIKDRIGYPNKTTEFWKGQFEMYQRAWLRSLGGRTIPKRHEIDALVLTTQRHVEEAGHYETVHNLLRIFVGHFDDAMDRDGWEFRKENPGVLNEARAVFGMSQDPSDTPRGNPHDIA